MPAFVICTAINQLFIYSSIIIPCRLKAENAVCGGSICPCSRSHSCSSTRAGKVGTGYLRQAAGEVKPEIQVKIIKLRFLRIRPFVFRPSGSGSNSTRYGSGSFYNQALTLIPTILCLHHDFLSLKNYINVASKSTDRM
jgi:hypothetical protein